MLGTIRKILGYLDWIALIAFFVVFGIYLLQKSIIVAIIVFLVALAILLIMLSKFICKFMPGFPIVKVKQLGEPLIDSGIFEFAISWIDKVPEYYYLFLAAIIMVSIDFTLWLIRCIDFFKK